MKTAVQLLKHSLEETETDVFVSSKEVLSNRAAITGSRGPINENWRWRVREDITSSVETLDNIGGVIADTHWTTRLANLLLTPLNYKNQTKKVIAMEGR